MGVVTWSLVFIALLFVLAAPLFWFAFHGGKRDLMQKFAIAAVVLGVVLGGLKVSMDNIIQDCRDAEIDNCNDVGSAGLMLLLGTGFTLVAWSQARQLHRRNNATHVQWMPTDSTPIDAAE